MSSTRDKAGLFRTGQSGNPAGRPRKNRSVDAAITKAMQEKVTITENGKRTRKPKIDISTVQLANKSAGGDLRATKLALELARKAEERAEVQAARAPVMTQSDHEIAARVIARLTKIIQEGDCHENADA